MSGTATGGGNTKKTGEIKKQVKLISLITDIAQLTVKGFITFHHNHVINLIQPGSFGHRGSDAGVHPHPLYGRSPPPLPIPY